MVSALPLFIPIHPSSIEMRPEPLHTNVLQFKEQEDLKGEGSQASKLADLLLMWLPYVLLAALAQACG
jgi:hypothetical protein